MPWTTRTRELGNIDWVQEICDFKKFKKVFTSLIYFDLIKILFTHAHNFLPGIPSTYTGWSIVWLEPTKPKLFCVQM